MSRSDFGALIPVLVLCFWSVPVGARETRLEPLPAGDNVFWSHAPYEAGECVLCHETNDPDSPGPLTAPVNETCLGCHEQMAEIMAGWSFTHAAAEDGCTNCHNPHNSERAKLVIDDVVPLCTGCHENLLVEAMESPVRHDAITSGEACMNCHNPHASNVEHLLISQPYDLCVNCHAEAMRDDQNREMVDIKSLVEASFMLHGPVERKDCSACHRTHGGETFRLLTHEYPAKFYASYDRDNYALCFDCHNEEVFSRSETTSLTGFRHGKQNLHFVHVNKDERGRTCRACHEVHGSPQLHLIREGVPYGSSGWVLKINYTKDENGGTCAKTCHGEKSYDRAGR